MLKSYCDKNARQEAQWGGKKRSLLCDPESESRLSIGMKEKGKVKMINWTRFTVDK